MTTTTSRVANTDNAPGDLNALEAALKAATTKAPAPAAQPGTNNQTKPEATQKPDWIQDKFWTGDLAESTRKQAEAYAPLQSAYGRMANDLGTQRKLTDQLLNLDKPQQNANGTPAQTPAPKVDPRRLVDNPTETLDAYWREREAILRKEMEQRQLQQEVQAAEQAFLAKHTDFNVVTASPEFLSWVNSSPLRKRAAVMAGRGDFSAADELLTEYKALQGKGPAPTDPNRGAAPQDPNLEAARKAGLETAANSGGAGGDGKPKGQLYRRADLIALKMAKPQVYSDPTFQAEILRAYAEGRVK